MTTTPTLPLPFKRGQGYFSLRTIKDTSGHTFIVHPRADTSKLATTVTPKPSVKLQDFPQDGEGSGIASPPELSRRSSCSSLFEGSLSPITPIASDEEDEGHKSKSPIANDRRFSPRAITPIAITMVDNVSPYDNCHKIKIYNGKPEQYWYYIQVRLPIASPPKVPRHKQVQKKALFICDVVGDEGRCTERQVWVNNGERKVKWEIAQGVNAVQKIDGKEYGFYIDEIGPHWVQKDTLTRLNRRALY